MNQIDPSYQVPTQPGSKPGEGLGDVQPDTSSPAVPGVSGDPQATDNSNVAPVVKTAGMNIENLLELTVQNDASDLHITVGYPIYIRVDGSLRKLGAEIITPDRAKELIYQVLDEQKREIYEVNKEVDLSYS
ncbi:MAG: hypothetical protein PHS44_07570, partial [Candidatus Dojkabacteria bacterium]|nr:hypothetical protein [Candidatus Dojkabacteria bacterium]